MEDNTCTVVSTDNRGLVNVQCYNFEKRESQIEYSYSHDETCIAITVHPLGYLMMSCSETVIQLHNW